MKKESKESKKSNSTRKLFWIVQRHCFILFAISILAAHTQAQSPIATKQEDNKQDNITGQVHCNGKGLSGVRVSDGIVTTETDKDGKYRLQSGKQHGYVFVTIPSGYQPVSSCNATPAFWSTLTCDVQSAEQRDFEMEKVDNDHHILLVATDLHLANRKVTSTNDMNQFRDGFLAESSSFVRQQKQPVYTLVLGDMTWDYFWYSNKYMPEQYKETMADYPSPLFHVIGNHDNDPYVTDDFLSEKPYKAVFGPTYYSMNLGKVHYIVLDNTIYLNAGGKEGVLGKRNYTMGLTEMQQQWLKEDLAAVADKSTPIVVAFHCPSTSIYNDEFVPKWTKSKEKLAKEFYRFFDPFSDVQLLSGHTHENAMMEFGTNISLEHNVAAVCETWWWSVKLSGLNVCKDGSPSGYKIFDINGTDFSWYYKSMFANRDKQFRAYDMNKVRDVLQSEAIAPILAQVGDGKDELSALPQNSILLNIWGYDTEWQISVRENGTELKATRKLVRDPLHRRYYEYTRSIHDGVPPRPEFHSVYNPHMFVVETGSATSTLEICVTDRFGKQYKETMVRPRAFVCSMD